MMKCKHAIITGGDIVPYGMSGAQLPDYNECDNPVVPEDEIDDPPCDESCPYFEAEVSTMNEENYCEHCAEMDLIVGFNLGSEYGNLDIRFDPENAEIDVIYLDRNIDHSIQINFCPFCGKKLRNEVVK